MEMWARWGFLLVLGRLGLGVLFQILGLAPPHLCQVGSVRWVTHSSDSLPIPVLLKFENWCQQILPPMFSFFPMKCLLVLSLLSGWQAGEWWWERGQN